MEQCSVREIIHVQATSARVVSVQKQFAQLILAVIFSTLDGTLKNNCLNIPTFDVFIGPAAR